MEGETRCSGRRLSYVTTACICVVTEWKWVSLKKKKKNFFFFFRETPTSLWVPFRAKFRPLGRLFRPSRPLAWSLYIDHVSYHASVGITNHCKPFGPRPSLTKHCARSGSKLLTLWWYQCIFEQVYFEKKTTSQSELNMEFECSKHKSSFESPVNLGLQNWMVKPINIIWALSQQNLS